jgi:tetratricopeptide (TPR) repeat protein
MRVIIFLVVVLAWVGSHKALAQLSEIDSLKALLPQAKDTARVNVLNLLSFKAAFSQPQEAENYARESITLADEIDFTRGHAHAYHSLGISFLIRTKYTEAIDAYTKSMQLLAALDTVRLKHRELKVNVLNSLGNIYLGQARYKESLDCFLRGVTIAESFIDKS